MKLTTVKIQNFRGISSLQLDLDDTTVLIGENNSGKTAVLEALRLCLRDLGPRARHIFDPLDFHLKDASADPTTAGPIQITVTFAEGSSGAWDTKQLRRLREIVSVGANGVNSVVLRVSCAYDDTKREFIQHWEFLDNNGIGRPQKEQQLATLQREIAYFDLTALRDAGRHFEARGQFWRPFLKDSQLDPAKRAEVETKLQEANDLVVASHATFGRATKSLQKIQEVVPIGSGSIASVEAVPAKIFDLLSRAQVQLSTFGGSKVPVSRHGEGTQSLAVLMLFAAFLEAWPNGAPIIALEEPEAHLHPAAIRALWSVASEIAGQKIVSTHSGDLLAEVPIESVRRLWRRNDQTLVSRLNAATLTEDDKRKFNYHIRLARGELLFARCWILVEGETEVWLVSELARQMGISLERAGVRCVPHRHASVELFLKVAKDFDISWCVLADNDQQGQADQRHARTYCPASQLANMLHVMPEDDIEGYLCSVGFGDVYQRVFDAHPQLHAAVPVPIPCSTCGHAPKTKASVTSSPGTPSYWKELLRTIKGVLIKPAAAQEVAELVRTGTRGAPPLIRAVIESAIKLAEAG